MGMLIPTRRHGPERSRHSLDLWTRQAIGQRCPLCCRIKQPLAAILGTGPLLDMAGSDQFPQDPRQTLFGDLEDLQELGHTQARVTVHEMEDTMMGASEAELL